MTRDELFAQLLAILQPEGVDPKSVTYYSKNEAQSGEWANIIEQAFARTTAGSAERAQFVDLLASAGFFKSTDDLNFWKNGASAENALDVNDLATAAEERFPGLLGGQSGTGSTVGPSAGGPAQPDGTPPGIMPGGTLTKINRDGADPLWAITYTVGGVQHVYTFDSYETVVATLGPDPATTYGMMTLNWDSVNDGDTWLLGDAAAFFGQTGQSYTQYFEATMQEAALEAGVRNPGLLGEYLSQPEIQRIMAMGEAGGWSDARIQAEIRNTDYYQNTLYPGINTFLNQGVPNPEAAYYNYMDSVGQSLAALGYEKDRFGTYRDSVGQMLEAGITAESFNAFAPTFIRAEQSGEFAATLNAWTERDLGVTLDFDNWFDVMAGNTDPELAQVVEKATIQFQADRAQTSLSAEQITRLADLTQFSEQQMTMAFTNAEEALLSVGQADLDRYGLSQEALVNAAFGVETGSMTATDIQRQAQKAATELGIQDDEKTGFFLGFDRFGRPNRQGLAASAPEAG